MIELSNNYLKLRLQENNKFITFQIVVRSDNLLGNLMSVRQTRHDYAYSHIGKNISDNFECNLCAEVVSVNAFYSHPEKAISESTLF